MEKKKEELNVNKETINSAEKENKKEATLKETEGGEA